MEELGSKQSLVKYFAHKALHFVGSLQLSRVHLSTPFLPQTGIARELKNNCRANGFLRSSMVFCDRQWFSAIVNGFLRSSMVFCDRQWFSAIVNGFLRSSMVFCDRQWFSAIAENRRNSRNQYFETELVVSRAYVKKGVAHAIILPTCARVQRVRIHGIQIKAHFETRSERWLNRPCQ